MPGGYHMLRTILLSAALTGVFAISASAQESNETRVFDTISVTGNDRFSDQDVLATSGLNTGQPLARIDLELAVEALDYTGEFKDISINALGNTLVIAVEETPAYSGDLTFGLGYDSDSGLIGVAGLSLTDIFTSGIDLNGEATISAQSRGAALEITHDALIGDGAVVGLRLTYDSYDFDNDLFGYERLSIGPFVTLPVGEESTLELRYAFVRDDLKDVDPDASGILQAEAGERDGSMIGATFKTSGLDPETQLRWGAQISQDFAGLGSDNSFSRTEGRLDASLPIAETGFALRTTLEFGAIRTDDDAGARATDRFTLGGTAMRGFERGGISVRDINGDVATSLGGETYAVARTDLVLPVFKDRDGVDAFLFADVGNVWNLSNVAAADGEVDVDGSWRQSAGVGVSLSTNLGRFEAYYAAQTEGLDADIDQSLGLAFRVQF